MPTSGVLVPVGFGVAVGMGVVGRRLQALTLALVLAPWLTLVLVLALALAPWLTLALAR
jgi:hypothetical protein